MDVLLASHGTVVSVDRLIDAVWDDTHPAGSKSVTVLIFAEGKAFVTLEFDSKPDDAVPAAFATDIGQKEDAAIKSALAD